MIEWPCYYLYEKFLIKSQLNGFERMVLLFTVSPQKP